MGVFGVFSTLWPVLHARVSIGHFLAKNGHGSQKKRREAKMEAGCHPLRSSSFPPIFSLLEKAKVIVGAGFKRVLDELGVSPISHPKI